MSSNLEDDEALLGPGNDRSVARSRSVQPPGQNRRIAASSTDAQLRATQAAIHRGLES